MPATLFFFSSSIVISLSSIIELPASPLLMRAIMPLYLFGGPGIAVRGVLLPLGATASARPAQSRWTRPSPTPHNLTFVRYSQHTNDELGGGDENGGTPSHWLGTGFNAAGFTLTPTLSHRGSGRSPRRVGGGSYVFIAIAHAGWCWHTKV